MWTRCGTWPPRSLRSGEPLALAVSAPFLPYGRQEISDADVEAVGRALRSAMITQGPLIAEFEAAVADYVGARHGVAFSSGTAALHGAMYAAGVGPGDDVITTPITFAGSANCARYLGGEPRFVDIDAATWNLDTEAAAAAAGPGTRAIVPVSFTGLPADLEPLQELRGRVTIVEDGCHAVGARRAGGMVGGDGLADMTAFSFHPVKTMTTGEGGLVTTDDDGLAARLRLFRTHGITRDDVAPAPWEGDWFYEMKDLGFNYRITDFQCALGLSQLRRVDDWVERRQAVAARYRELLAGDGRLVLPPEPGEGATHAHHLFVVLVAAGRDARLQAFRALRATNIGVQVHYIPVYRLPYYRDVLGRPQDDCPAAEHYYERAISLPVFPGMTDDDITRVVDVLGEALA